MWPIGEWQDEKNKEEKSEETFLLSEWKNGWIDIWMGNVCGQDRPACSSEAVTGAGIGEETVCGLKDSLWRSDDPRLRGWMAFVHHRSKASTSSFMLRAQEEKMVF